MNETYSAFASFAQTWGLLYFMILFGFVLAYALWPKNSKKFDDAAQIPFRED
ncbi:cbb3-type cytochrome c oxidase subunit 3 [Labrenzia sp. PHM005]|jgi:cytochrome c oxidase cbb3-type subunit 4|uniref:cbb3-type cytochrome c oxidase subunit 3 n=1 Tax=Stappiaceae TaxID=2821832 RepID=UPI0011403589|nr:cbb3-type cytochrome c oxidase subunit 3 [Labrenzia sp. PHM005]QDG78784.1 cbb3-type cytochrome c oxidase subunit 3 [Labrenzia sp. PHM005]